jgi:type IV pilus assembly protein PilC
MARESNMEVFIAARGISAAKSRVGKRSSPLADLPFLNNVTAQDKATFLSQLSMMLRARVPIVKALEILAGQTRSSKMKGAISDLLADVRKGSSFSASLAHQPEIFDPLLVVTAEVGQESGRLPDVLSSLAEHMERMNALRRKVMQALAYPVLVLVVAALVVSFLLLYIVPTFADMFRTSNVQIPNATRIVINASNILSSNWPYLIIVVILMAAASKWMLGNDWNKAVVEKYGPHVPWIGSVMTKNYSARFCRTLGTLLQSQVPLVDALKVTKRIFENRLLRSEIERLIKSVKQGRAVADQLSTSTIFSPVVAQMIAVGEETSELETMLLKVASFYEEEIEDMMETLTTVIEPVLIVILGAIVGTILITMYLPMFDMANAVGGAG